MIVFMLAQFLLSVLVTVLQGMALGAGFAVGKSLLERKQK